MSYAVMPYLVDLDKIRRFGSYDTAYADRMLQHMSDYARQRLQSDFDDEDVIEPADLLRQLLCGEPKVAGMSHRYAYALEAYCRMYGEDVANEGWWGMRSGYFGVVESALADIGVKFDPFDLVIGGVPTPLAPSESGFPLFGSLDLDEIDKYAAVFEAANLDDLTDPDIRRSVDQIVDWLRTCRESRLGLVCFYY